MAEAIKKCFYAYSSRHLPTLYTITNAVSIINDNSAAFGVEVKPWQSMNISGVLLLNEIRLEIDDCDVFMCDLTRSNMNVLFELGYAIVQNKRIWISRNEAFYAVDDERVYKELGILDTIGYSPYTAADGLAWAFLNGAPFNDTENAIFKEKIENQQRLLQAPRLLYLKSQIPTPEAAALTRQIHKSSLPVITDDPLETQSRPLEWYVEKLLNSFGVIAHFVDETQDELNVKYALISGMAYGLQLDLLMLAHAPYKPAIDYKDLIFIHKNIRQLTERVDTWLLKATDKFERLTKRHEERQRRMEAVRALERINIGEYEAEGEQNQLLNYFVETAEYKEALKTSQYKIFVGRKGSGKTANFYKMTEELRSRPNTHVCVMKPASIDIEGIYRLFSLSLSEENSGNLAENLWKFLIYTELASDCYFEIYSKPAPTLTHDETNFIKFVKGNQFILTDFSLRLEHALHDLCEINFTELTSINRSKISQVLHEVVIADLRRLLGLILREKEKVFILLDNLDQAWKVRDDLTQLAQFLFGLLDVGQVIASEFQQNSSTKQRVELAIIVFIRSDIFSYILEYSKEKDKLHTLIAWNNPQLLLRVIEERFRKSLTGLETSEEIWDTFFVETVKGLPTRQYIVNHILPRPRDVIFFCKQAYYHAVNSEHSRIEESDILQAEKDYSQHCVFTLEAETKAQMSQIPELFCQLMGEEEIITRERLEELMSHAHILKKDINKAINLLCAANFLGLEVDLFQFEFVYDERLKHRRIQAKKAAEKIGKERYKINPPFHAFLEIVPYTEQS